MEQPIAAMRGVGPARTAALAKMGIITNSDLIAFLPVAYRDMSAPRELPELVVNEECAFRARVLGKPTLYYSGQLCIVRTRLTGGGETLPAVWFNQPWLLQKLQDGQEYVFYGRLSAGASGPSLSCPLPVTGEGIQPVYRPTPGVPAYALRALIARALDMLKEQPDEPLPARFRERHSLITRAQALEYAHRPPGQSELSQARRALAFEELLLYQAAVYLMRGTAREGVRIACPRARIDEFLCALPFALTGAQARVVNEIAEGLEGKSPMARLVQGDVGSGKTAVALCALYLAACEGWQGALMAPTEILAAQHLQAAQALLAPLGVRCGLLTGGLGARQRREALEAIETGAWQVVIGTHALFERDVRFAKLGLAVTDEQHRFGVRQRSMLSEKGESPNMLVMSATPIPRTLALILYGDLDLSVIDELPPGRRAVATHIVPEQKRADMYGFLRAQVRAGRQVYVVCPLVEESDALDAPPAEQVYRDLSEQVFADLRVALVHGRMRGATKEAALTAFAARETDILVSTTVIEVGVNVPNATVMVVESAERFGLSQLHQLRGRVGRGAEQSYCFLMAQPNARLQTLCQTNDGFVIAQKDLEMRGAGELLGTRQHGLPIASASAMMADAMLLAEAHTAFRELIAHGDAQERECVLSLARGVHAQRIEQLGVH